MITISGFSFEGPFTTTANLPNHSGVYVIMDFNPNKGGYTVIDVGEATDIRSRVESHDRKDCWNKEIKHSITYASCYTGPIDDTRRQVERRIRDYYGPPCGER